MSAGHNACVAKTREEDKKQECLGIFLSLDGYSKQFSNKRSLVGAVTLAHSVYLSLSPYFPRSTGSTKCEGAPLVTLRHHLMARAEFHAEALQCVRCGKREASFLSSTGDRMAPFAVW